MTPITTKRPWPRIHGTPLVRSGRYCATTSITFPVTGALRSLFFILLERRRKRRVLLVGLGDLPLIFWRIESVKPRDFFGSGERLHRQIGVWAPKFGAEA